MFDPSSLAIARLRVGDTGDTDCRSCIRTWYFSPPVAIAWTLIAAAIESISVVDAMSLLSFAIDASRCSNLSVNSSSSDDSNASFTVQSSAMHTRNNVVERRPCESRGSPTRSVVVAVVVVVSTRDPCHLRPDHPSEPRFNLSPSPSTSSFSLPSFKIPVHPRMYITECSPNPSRMTGKSKYDEAARHVHAATSRPA